ncbi:DUF6207 family protein [Streptomyces sp. NPDC059862]|uniref:DUF6207 family protein n=1 Tax=unclassified Streptomyces TaxID=2593676 RepID=UPI003632315B
MPRLRSINKMHVTQSGLAVVEVAAATTRSHSQSRNCSPGDGRPCRRNRTTREPGEPGVRLHGYPDLRREPGS